MNRKKRMKAEEGVLVDLDQPSRKNGYTARAAAAAAAIDRY